MPIFVNVPGSGDLDTAGRGVAAAQQYRGNEQKMRSLDLENKRRDESMAAEIGLATRKLDIEEADMKFQREQLAQQQEAAGDLLVAEMGAGLTEQQKRALFMVSPRTQNVLLEGVARNKRLAAEQETLSRADTQLAELEKNEHVGKQAAELRARIADGSTTPGAAVDAIARVQREADKIAVVERQFVTVSAQMEKWTADETGAYDPPKEDDDAFDDVVDLEAKLSPNAPFDPKADYRALWDQYKFLTTKGMREASRAILAAELEKKGLVPVDRAEYEKMLDERLASSSENPEFREKAGATYGQAAAFTDRVVGPMRSLLGGGKVGGSPGASPGGTQPAPATGSKLMQPIPEAEVEQLGYGQPNAHLRDDFMDAMGQLGFTAIPQAGEPEYKVARQVMAAVKARRAQPQAVADVKPGAAKPGADGKSAPKGGGTYEQLQAVRAAIPSIGEVGEATAQQILDLVNKAAEMGVSGALKAISPSEESKRANARKTRRDRGVQ